LRRPALAVEAPMAARPMIAEPVAAAEFVPVVQEEFQPPVTVKYFPVGEVVADPPPAQVPRYVADAAAPPMPVPDLAVFYPDPYPQVGAPEPAVQASISGIVFTAVLSPKDGRKNWQDIVTAFAQAFQDTPDATLVLKMIGADPTYWWWEFNIVMKALPPFQCRIMVLSGYLDDAAYQALIAATHFVVNASLAEGQCLPLVEFMSGYRPAIAPLHTAMLDYIRPENAVIVASSEEFCSWPHDPRNHLITTRHRIEWPSLRDAYRAAYDIARNDPARWHAMGQDAARSVQGYCADLVLGPALAAFLGLGDAVVTQAGWQPKPVPAAEAAP
jgi:glycosyltransferase involved in cell wall biosynthesis